MNAGAQNSHYQKLPADSFSTASSEDRRDLEAVAGDRTSRRKRSSWELVGGIAARRKWSPDGEKAKQQLVAVVSFREHAEKTGRRIRWLAGVGAIVREEEASRGV